MFVSRDLAMPLHHVLTPPSWFVCHPTTTAAAAATSCGCTGRWISLRRVWFPRDFSDGSIILRGGRCMHLVCSVTFELQSKGAFIFNAHSSWCVYCFVIVFSERMTGTAQNGTPRLCRARYIWIWNLFFSVLSYFNFFFILFGILAGDWERFLCKIQQQVRIPPCWFVYAIFIRTIEITTPFLFLPSVNYVLIVLFFIFNSSNTPSTNPHLHASVFQPCQRIRTDRRFLPVALLRLSHFHGLVLRFFRSVGYGERVTK